MNQLSKMRQSEANNIAKLSFFGTLGMIIGLICIWIAYSFGLWGDDHYQIVLSISQGILLAISICILIAAMLWRNYISSNQSKILQHTVSINECTSDLSYCLILEDNKIFLGHKELSLTAKEFQLLSLLLQHSDEVCEYDYLIQQIWPETYEHPDRPRDQNNLTQLVRSIRQKINIHEFIENHTGRGYEFKQWKPKP